ncbi:cob(I)yrinic acid a,c-diamide adenosyltransferase [Sinosporangium siamense]|uniref:Corrinoid adenosyltransferase n=1 Tax=Sinosporangium siamense TaxID=1367973 RepID=A0A919RMK1_9ACTN|nr:cob(I)yrinic acid a,c-diamide adenosyltransferase [Sinosporangium siamense]GII96547.1 ATP--cob(I)alamin adenosyltransferase [Sinosporangium siamense]
MKLYTRGGDKGETGIWGGKRVGKDTARIEAIGSVDECNALIGLAIAMGLPGDIGRMLETAQNNLFVVGGELMAPSREGSGTSLPRLSGDEIQALEGMIDELDARVPPLRNFILPGGVQAAAQLHVARTVCRRAERRAAQLNRQEGVSEYVLAYLNRLADLLFVMARAANHSAGAAETQWAPRG